MEKIKKWCKNYLPPSWMAGIRCLKDKIIPCYICLDALLHYPLNISRAIMVKRDYLSHSPDDIKRIFNYRHSLLPNSFLAEREEATQNIDIATQRTGLSIGYPAWNLLYYSLLCSLNDTDREVVVVETGTNLGYSTIVMAQALSDLHACGFVHTVDIDGENIELAKKNVEKSGMSNYVKFYTADAIAFLKNFVKEKKYIDFIFIDDLHSYGQVKKEFSIIYPHILACKGKVYFDNTSMGGVCNALYFIKKAYRGNIIEFGNCSWGAPGNAIWQPD